MFSPRRGSWLAALFLVVVSLHAQTSVEVSGHWEGVVRAPQMDIAIGVDLAMNAEGVLAGTFDNPARKVRGLPLSNVVVDGTSVTFEIRASGGGAFRGRVDGKSMTGTFTTTGPDAKPLELPFELARKGEARIETTPKSAAVSGKLEGRWTGTLAVEGKLREIGLTLTNHSDGTATGVLISGDGQEIPITRIAEAESRVTLEVTRIGGSYEGTLNAAGTELSGTWTQESFVGALTFRRVAAANTAVGPIDRWANAVGGREKVSSITSVYREATLEWRGVQGSIRAWRAPDGRYRKEERIASLSTVETFDGTNGTLQQNDAPARAMTAAELARARSTAFANSGAMFFAFFPEGRRGTVATEGDDTVVLRPEGGIDWRVTLDRSTSLPKTMTHKENERTITVTFVSWETVDGVRFEKELHRSAGDPRFDSVIRFTKTVTNAPIDGTLFTIASKQAAR